MNTINGTNNDDRIVGTGDSDGIFGLGGDDEIMGVAGDDVLLGGDGNDRLGGGSGNDSLFGEAGDDLLSGGHGADIMDGGSGRDTVSYIGSLGGVFVNLSSHIADGGDATGDQLASIENVTGTSFDDLLIGDDGMNVLSGGDGRDFLDGGLGNDVIDGGQGLDIIDGGSGIDTVSYLSATEGVGVNLLLDSGGWGDTLTSIENVDGSLFRDFLYGDNLDNRLRGFDGNDVLHGQGGNDVLDGGKGSDVLQGDAGNDTFLFTTALGSTNVDRITDFSVVRDTIKLENGVFKGLAAGELSAGAFKDVGVAGAKVDANDHILYDHNTGALFYDADGSGAAKAVQFATLTDQPTLTYHDILIV